MWYFIGITGGIVIIWVAISVIRWLYRKKVNYYEIKYYRDWGKMK